MIADFFASTAMQIRNSFLENPNYALNDPALTEFWNAGSVSDAGLIINHRNSLTLGVVFGIVANISGDIASMPMECMQVLENGGQAPDFAHPSSFRVAAEWNDETPAFDGWRRFQAHELLWSNAYAYIERRSLNSPMESLYNLLPDRTRPHRLDDGRLVYITEVDGEPEVLFKEEVLHVKGLSLENQHGLDLILKAKNAIGLALASQGYTSKFFANNAQTGGIITIPPGFSEKAAQKLEEGFRRRTSKDNWFKTMIVRDGAKFEAATIDAQKAQLHELNEDQVRDLCRYWSYPPFKAGLRDSESYNSVEMEQLIYLCSCLLHRMSAVKGECGLKLLSPAERRARSHFYTHNKTTLLEMDSKTHNEVLAIQRQNEVINANDWLRDTGRPLRSDAKASEYYNPNTKGTPSTAQGDQTEPAKNPPAPKKTKNVGTALRGVLADAINRVARRVTFDAKATSKKQVKFLQWIDGGALEHRGVFDEAMSPGIQALAFLTGRNEAAICCDLSGRFFSELTSRLKPLLEPPHLAQQLTENVTTACLKFEAEIENILLTPIMEQINASEIIPDSNQAA